MAMATWLQMVSEAEIAALRANPPSINKLDKPAAESFRTYYFCSINYFVTGDAWGGGTDDPVGGMLSGFASVECSTLENGSFNVVTPAQAAQVSQGLDKLDVDAIKAKVDDADPDEIEEAEVDDFEILMEADEPAGEVIVSEVQSLAKFYKDAANKQLGVVMYTT